MEHNQISQQRRYRQLPLWAALIPVAVLLFSLVGIVVFKGSSSVTDYSQIVLLLSSLLGIVLVKLTGTLSVRGLKVGFVKSARQILPTIPMLVCIAMVATTWMLSGVVPTLIDYGMQVIQPTYFLAITCIVCSAISVLTGSSWSTIATIGVAFLGIGRMFGFSDGWIAGAIISGAYFGDKMSPLSDTTVVASSVCGVDLFKHIRYLVYTAAPTMALTLLIFTIVGLVSDLQPAAGASTLLEPLRATFRITPWTLLIPAVTFGMIALRVPTLITLFSSAVLGFIGIFVFQPAIGADFMSNLTALWSGASLSTGNDVLDNLVSTNGIVGMVSTISLLLSSMVFGAVIMGAGILTVLTESCTRGLRKRTSIVGSTVGAGVFMNCCTADQYLALIVTGNMFRNVYTRSRIEPKVLSRSLEDGISVTSVLVPWNTCGLAQSSVLGLSTLAYFPYCLFNILSPLMSVFMAWIGFKVPTPPTIQAGQLKAVRSR